MCTFEYLRLTFLLALFQGNILKNFSSLLAVRETELFSKLKFQKNLNYFVNQFQKKWFYRNIIREHFILSDCLRNRDGKIAWPKFCPDWSDLKFSGFNLNLRLKFKFGKNETLIKLKFGFEPNMTRLDLTRILYQIKKFTCW